MMSYSCDVSYKSTDESSTDVKQSIGNMAFISSRNVTVSLVHLLGSNI